MRRWWFPLLVVWTAYVWITRIVNTWSDTDTSLAVQIGSTLLAVSLLAPAAVLGVVWFRSGRDIPLPAPFERALVWFCAWTTIVWCVRVPMIVLARHDVPFKVVHAVLGLISIALAVAVFRQTEAARARARRSGRTPATVDPR